MNVRFLLVFVCALSVGYGRHYDNPVIDVGDKAQVQMYPTVVKYGAEYFAVVTVNGTYQLHSSSDLQSWTQQGNILSKPCWPQNVDALAPRIFVSKSNDIRLFYGKYNSSSSKTNSFGVAYAEDVRGPYYPSIYPLMDSVESDIEYPFVFQEDNATYLYFTADNNKIGVFTLNQDFLAVTSADYRVILDYDTSTGFYLHSTSVIKRNGFYYLFYSVGSCGSDMEGLKVARSLSPLGPFEKQDVPLILPGDSGAFTNVIRDPEGIETAIYQYTGIFCHTDGIYANTLLWDGNWPIAERA